MIISQAAVTMSSSHYFSQEHTRQASGQVWTGAPPPAAGPAPSAAPESGPEGATVTISTAARALQAQAVAPPLTGPIEPAVGQEEAPDIDPRLRAMRRVLELLTGKKIALTGFQALTPNPPNFSPPTAATNPAQPQGAGWGLRIDLKETRSEHEELAFRAQGTIATGDGRQLNFNAQLTLSRAFSQSSELHLRAGDALLIDPLLINFSGQAPALSEQTMAFDLNRDGRLEKIALLRPGSGFLALDRNQNGKIDNGGELFGPQSGNGFAELAAYDSDGNGWLDGKDPLTAQLQIWTQNEDGGSQLFSLAEKGIGAILLDSAPTPFALKDSTNQLQGQLQKTGIFLKENGEVGTIQELDLVV